VVTEIKPQVITIPNYDELKIKTGKWGELCQVKFQTVLVELL
jgi:hypothetical protein